MITSRQKDGLGPTGTPLTGQESLPAATRYVDEIAELPLETMIEKSDKRQSDAIGRRMNGRSTKHWTDMVPPFGS